MSIMHKFCFFCIMPNYFNNEGHENSFIKCYEKIINKNIFFLVPKENSNRKNRAFNKVINNKKSNFFFTKILSEISFFFCNIKSINVIIKNKHRNNKSIVFLDGGSLFFLLSFFFLSNKKNITFIYYLRSSYNQIIKEFFFFLILKKFNKIFFNFKLVTDSLLLKNFLLRKTKLNAFILPIPHTVFRKINILKNNLDCINLFCPGGFRADKFGNNLNLFLKNHDKYSYNLVINKDFIKPINITQIKLNYFSNLNKKEYYDIFKNSDFILLPYEQESYKLKTSGIFVETIIFGRIPIVTSHTWMADQLKMFNLRELIVDDWGFFKLSKLLKDIKKNLFYKKLRNMQIFYNNFHNEDSFINKFTRVIKQ